MQARREIWGDMERYGEIWAAPMQRMRKRPSSSKMLTVRWPHIIQRNMASGIEARISKRPARVSSSELVKVRVRVGLWLGGLGLGLG